jgi:hypothetical protein
MINEPRLVIYSGKLRDLAVLKQEYEFAGFVEIDIKQGGKVSPKSLTQVIFSLYPTPGSVMR